MATNIFDSFRGNLGQQLSKQISKVLNEPESNTNDALQNAVSGLLGGLVGNSNDDQKTKNTFDSITDDSNNFSGLLDNIEDTLSGDNSSSIMNQGEKIINQIFGGSDNNSVNNIINTITGSGVNRNSARNLLMTAAPFLYGTLGRQVRDGGLNAQSFQNMIQSQYEYLKNAAPEMLKNLNLDSFSPQVKADANAIRSDVDKIQGNVEKLGSDVNKLGQDITSDIKKGGEKLVGDAQKAGEQFVDRTQKAGEQISGSVNKAGETLAQGADKAKDALDKSTEKVGNIVDKASKSASSTVGGVASKVGDTLGKGTSKAGAAMSGAVDSAGKTLEKGAEKAKNTMDGGGGFKLGPILGIVALVLAGIFLFRQCNGSQMVDKAKETAGDVVDATGDAASKAGDAVGNAAGAVADAVTSLSLPNGKSIDIEPGSYLEKFVNVLSGKTDWDMSKPFVAEGYQFETGSANLTAESRANVEKLAAALDAYPDAKIRLEGYTDNTGDSQANLLLSQNRANSIKSTLEELGVAKDRVQALGKGDANPIADNGTPEGREKNRRVEVYITAK